jgi:tetratricopeptide (TPR) repeat protein
MLLKQNIFSNQSKNLVMKNVVKILFFIGLTLKVQAQITSPQASPTATNSQAIGLATVSVEYSRPSLKGRKMMGSTLIPYGQVWRTGANKIPNLKLSHDVTIEGNKVAAGTYGILTIPTEKDWTIILSKNEKQWGAYEYKQTEDLLRFTVKSAEMPQNMEHFTMEFTDFTPTTAKLAIRWENTEVKFSIAHDPEATIMADIKTKMAATEIKGDTYYDAANYYFENGKDLNQAFEWSNKLLETSKEYWTYYLRAKIAAKLGKCDIAVQDSNAGLELAKKEKDAAYITNFEKILKTCGK